MRSATGCSTSKSSPYTITARSVRTPEISSLKRSSMGWLNSNALPICLSTMDSSRPSSASLSSDLSGHSAFGLRTITLSEMLTGIGSIAASAVPVRVKIVSTSGSLVMAFSSASCIASDCSSEAEGTRKACIARLPSSRVGMNSRPSETNAVKPMTSMATAPISTRRGRITAARMTGSALPRTKRMIRVSCSPSCLPSWLLSFSRGGAAGAGRGLGSRTNSAAIAGTKVKERMNAPTRASMKVAAIGWNVLPSTPSSVRIGANTSRMMS